MGRPKGRKSGYKFWTAKEKYDLILPIINGEISAKQLAKDIGMSGNGMLIKWIHQYQEGGIEALENKKKPGNKLSKFARRKELTELEKLQYENLLLKIENERLKKGYTVKEVNEAHAGLSKKNMK